MNIVLYTWLYAHHLWDSLSATAVDVEVAQMLQHVCFCGCQSCRYISSHTLCTVVENYNSLGKIRLNKRWYPNWKPVDLSTSSPFETICNFKCPWSRYLYLSQPYKKAKEQSIRMSDNRQHLRKSIWPALLYSYKYLLFIDSNYKDFGHIWQWKK